MLVDAVVPRMGQLHEVGAAARGLDGSGGAGLRRARWLLAIASSGVAWPSDLPASSSTPTTRWACGSTTSLTVLARQLEGHLEALARVRHRAVLPARGG